MTQPKGRQLLAQGFGLLQTESSRDVAVVIDASESAWEYREEILQVAVQLFENLPASIGKSLYFLGNPETYDISKLQGYSTKWWEQNKKRGSFISPILEHANNSSVIVIGSGIIYDLEDWQGSQWDSKLHFLKFGESLRGGVEIAEESNDLSEALDCLYNPIISIEISGTSFMPYNWTNPKYILSTGEIVTLQGQNLEDPSISIAFFGSDVKAKIVRRSGQFCIPLKSVDYKEQLNWSTLQDKECEIFHKAMNGERITCPICAKNHLVSGLRCDSNSIRGEVIFSSLREDKGFVFFKETPNGVLFRVHPVSVAKIGDAEVAIISGSRAKIYKYNQTEQQWRESGYLKPYQAFEDGYMAVI